MTENVTQQPGDKIAGYVLEAQIGEGGMAVVFRARDEGLGRPVALKLLAPGLAGDDGFRQRFIRESRAAAAVDHPNIIPIYEAGEADGVLFIAMRYVQGGDVRALIDRGGPLPAARAWAIVSQVAVALDAAHRHGLIHRDVKPGNILLDAEHVYLSDFGISKQRSGTSSLTMAGQFVGTLDYIAPEQIDGHGLDGRADLYSLGCAAYELLSGKPPFRQSQGLALVRAHLSEPPPALTAERPDLPPAINRVLAGAMAKSPEERYRTCAQFAADLGRSLGLVGGDPAPPATGGPLRTGAATELARPAPPRMLTRPAAPPGPPGPGPARPQHAGQYQPRQVPHRAPRHRARGVLTGGITVVAVGLAAAAVAAVLVSRGHGPSPTDAAARSPVPARISAPARTPAAPGIPAVAGTPSTPAAPAAPAIAPSAAAPSAAPSTAPPNPATQTQATAVNSLLASGAGTNPRLLTALSSINQCTDVAGSVSALTQIRDQRSSEYGQAQGISVSALPQGAALKTDLAQALYYSLQADDQYLSWASQQSQGPCRDDSEPSIANDNDQASAYKTSFTQHWNPIALQYDLTTQSVTSM